MQMSRQNKNARLRKAAKVIQAMHLKGEKGPARTVAKHGKKFENTLKYKKTVAARATK
jgi:hypothetical protein